MTDIVERASSALEFAEIERRDRARIDRPEWELSSDDSCCETVRKLVPRGIMQRYGVGWLDVFAGNARFV
jgi:hypothetical protein